MAKVSGNGRYVKAAQQAPAGKSKPLGAAPKDFDKIEREIWKELAEACAWLDKSHRLWLRGVCKIAARIRRIEKFFAARTAECIKNKIDDAQAMMDDKGNRHPLLTELNASESGFSKMSAALGVPPTVRARMLSNITKEKMPEDSDVEGSPADRKRFFK